MKQGKSESSRDARRWQHEPGILVLAKCVRKAWGAKSVRDYPNWSLADLLLSIGLKWPIADWRLLRAWRGLAADQALGSEGDRSRPNCRIHPRGACYSLLISISMGRERFK